MLHHCPDALFRFRCKPIRETEIYRRPHVVFNRVDGCSRKLFPATFLVLNLFYWIGYMYVFDHFESDVADINTGELWLPVA